MSKRLLTNEEVSEILSLTPDDINKKLLVSYFAVTKGKDLPRFNTYDHFILEKNKFHNSKAIDTTVGRYIFNMFVIPGRFYIENEYMNDALDKKHLKKFESILTSMLLNDKLTVDEYTSYLDKGEWLAMSITPYIVPTMNYEINNPIPDVIAKRDELFKKYEKEIKAGDTSVISQIEKELLDLSKKDIKKNKNQAMDFFDCGEFEFGNAYKKTSIMGGAMENPYTHKIETLKTNYIEGLNKEDYLKSVNLTIQGGISRGVDTQKGGYASKKVNNGYQAVVLDDDGTDCKTTKTLDIVLDEFNSKILMYRYIVDPESDSPDGLTLLTSDNINKFIGKKVRLRSPLYCKSHTGICSKCAGELYHKIGIKNIGLTFSGYTESLKNMSMKRFHDSTVKFLRINTDDFITEL